MTNLLKETIAILKEHGKTIEDIKWIGCNAFKISLENFLEVADTEYDDGFGSPEVALDLVIVGDDFYLERSEYDGAEGWEYRGKIEEPKDTKEIKYLTTGQSNAVLKDCIGAIKCFFNKCNPCNYKMGWVGLEELNKEREQND
ncbi:hypothetical protein LJC10_00605 [Selenomonadales bacterium OttesenSCG-928-I06]|nr:hypothetical protein [Selenomonadales bacterium OttesenSCG-928-I06]